MLHTEIQGAGARVVLVHGFTQTQRSWDPVGNALAAHHEVVRVDLPGHGGSAAVRLGFAETAAAVGEAGGRGAYVGYSLGGRLCLRLSLDRPDLVTALVLVGASPGLADASERAARREADEALAAVIERGSTNAFLDRWLAQPLFAGFRASPEDLAARRANPPDGLAAALRVLGTGVQEPLWDRLGELAVPVLLVAGADDAKFSALARRMARRMADILGRSRPALAPPSLTGSEGGGRPVAAAAVEVALVAGAGHAAHLEQPAPFVAVVRDFLDRHQAS